MSVRKSGTLFVNSGEIVEEETIPKQEIPEDSAITKAREELKKIKEARNKLSELADKSTIIFQTQSAFPFQLFPDKIIVELDKITIVRRSFAMKNVFPILLDNLNSISVTRGFFFASLSFEITGYETNPGDIEFLWASDAAKAKRIIMGLVNARKQGVDVSKIPLEELKSDLEEIGKTTGDIETLPMA